MEPANLQLTRCPECTSLAEIVHRVVLESTDGPMEHVKIRCARRHWSFIPVRWLDDVPTAAPRRTRTPERR
jgi:hypothetical protein